MSKKLLFLISFVLVLGLVNNAFSLHLVFQNGDISAPNDWNDGDNWYTNEGTQLCRVPDFSDSQIRINQNLPLDSQPFINAGTKARCGHVYIGSGKAADGVGKNTLTVLGSLILDHYQMRVGYKASGYGTLNIRGNGDVNTINPYTSRPGPYGGDVRLANYMNATGTLNMEDPNCRITTRVLYIGKSDFKGASAHVNLMGGTIRLVDTSTGTANFTMNDSYSRNQSASMDITGGQIIADDTYDPIADNGGLADKIEGYLGRGLITAYGSGLPGSMVSDPNYYVLVDYNSVSNITTVKAVLYPDTMASAPVPADYKSGVPIDQVLSWTPGNDINDTNAHTVWFGTDRNGIENGGYHLLCEPNVVCDQNYANPPNCIPDVNCVFDVNCVDLNDVNCIRVYYDSLCAIDANCVAERQTATSYTPTLERFTTYWWRVDEHNDANVSGVVTRYEGKVWKFVTVKHIEVDGFEDYNDPNSYLIGGTWSGDANITLCVDPNFTNYGDQSMRFDYNNVGGGSDEAYRKIDPCIADWTQSAGTYKGDADTIGVMDVWFYGNTGNSTDDLYVKLKDKWGTSATLTYGGTGQESDEDPNNLRKTKWSTWHIDLSRFTDVNLPDVNDIYLGVSGSSAGILYFDDIRLYGKRCLGVYAPELDQDSDCRVNFRDFAKLFLQKASWGDSGLWP